MRNLPRGGRRGRSRRLSRARRHAGRLGQDGAHLRLLRVLPPRGLPGAVHKKRIAITMGAASLRELFDEKYYAALDGGILESFGRLFKNDLRLYVYPLLDQATGKLVTVDNLEVAPHLHKLYGYLVENGYIGSWRTSTATTCTSSRETLCARSGPAMPAGNRWCRPRSRRSSRPSVSRLSPAEVTAARIAGVVTCRRAAGWSCGRDVA